MCVWRSSTEEATAATWEPHGCAGMGWRGVRQVCVLCLFLAAAGKGHCDESRWTFHDSFFAGSSILSILSETISL